MHSETLMQFDKLEAALELEVYKVEAQRKGWTIALVSKKVYCSGTIIYRISNNVCILDYNAALH